MIRGPITKEGQIILKEICTKLKFVARPNIWEAIDEAREHRAKGQELAVGISADAEKQREVILASAYSASEKIRGEGDAEAASIYASAFNKDKEFYKFYRSMDAYKKSFSSKSDVLLIDTDSDYFKYLKDGISQQ